MQPQLSPEQYEQVLKYLQATGDDDFQTATLILKQHNFNLNTAINAKFNSNQSGFDSNPRPNRQQEPEQNDEIVIRKFIQHVKKQNQSWSAIGYSYTFVKNLTFGLIKLVSQIILPEWVLKKFLRSRFYVLYKEEIKLTVHDVRLNAVLMQTKQKSHKPCFLVISPNNKSDSIVRLLNNIQIVNKIKESFFFVGSVSGDQQVKPIQNQQPPEIIICRYNVYKEIVILRRFIGQEEVSNIQLGQLNRLLQQSRNHQKRDKNVLIKYRNLLRRQIHGPMHIEEEEEEEINHFVRQQTSQHIQSQNEQYRRVQQEELKRLTELRIQEQQNSKQLELIEQKQEERKFRKMSIPDEPLSGDIIRFMFRCPDGTTKSRSFCSDQKVEILYNWVQTNQQIELQDNKKREFQILYSYPPTPLLQMKQKVLKQIFESDQEKLLIREL